MEDDGSMDDEKSDEVTARLWRIGSTDQLQVIATP